jgi:hypothetical protein
VSERASGVSVLGGEGRGEGGFVVVGGRRAGVGGEEGGLAVGWLVG